jgi:cell division protein FtsB
LFVILNLTSESILIFGGTQISRSTEVKAELEDEVSELKRRCVSLTQEIEDLSQQHQQARQKLLKGD